MARERVAAVAEIPPGRAKTCMAGGKALAVVNLDGKFHAIDNTCVHRGGPLGEGAVDGNSLICPWHGWQFDLSTGECTTNPAVRVGCYEVSVDGDEVYVEV